jgi:hypothetical protein
MQLRAFARGIVRTEMLTMDCQLSTLLYRILAVTLPLEDSDEWIDREKIAICISPLCGGGRETFGGCL